MLMRKVFLRILMVLGLGLSWVAFSDMALAEPYGPFLSRLLAQGSAQNLFQPAVEQRLVALVNDYRHTKGLVALADDAGLKGAARGHAADMALHNFMGHRATSGHDFDSRMHALRPGVMVLPAMGENAATMHPALGGAEAVAQQLFKAWLSSPPHVHTMLSRDYIRVASGVAVYGGKAYADQIFIGPAVQTNLPH
jgi:uncharacterized protein YkwD